MKPRKPEAVPQDDLFKHWLDDLVNPNLQLVRLAHAIGWELLDRELGQHFSDTAGASALLARLMAGLMYLQHAYRWWLSNGWNRPNGSTSAVSRSFNTSFPATPPA